MKNNHTWIFEQIRLYLGNNVLEVGSGIGNISKFIISLNRNVILTDINEAYLEYLRYRFFSNPSEFHLGCH